jgi:hypothetical protein
MLLGSAQFNILISGSKTMHIPTGKHFESRTSLEDYIIPLPKDFITANTMIRYSFSHSTLETEATNLPETLINQPTTTRFHHPQQET